MLVYHLVSEYLQESSDAPGITLIDGYPKEPELVTLIDQQNKQGVINVVGTIEIAVSDCLAMTRQIGRKGITSTHPDYGGAVAQERIELHNSRASSVSAHLARIGTYLTIDGDRPMTDVQADFIASLRSLCVVTADEIGA